MLTQIYTDNSRGKVVNIIPKRKRKPLNTFFGGCENAQNLLGQVNSWFGDKDINQTFFKEDSNFWRC